MLVLLRKYTNLWQALVRAGQSAWSVLAGPGFCC
jgi:hypothetical protein